MKLPPEIPVSVGSPCHGLWQPVCSKATGHMTLSWLNPMLPSYSLSCLVPEALEVLGHQLSTKSGHSKPSTQWSLTNPERGAAQTHGFGGKEEIALGQDSNPEPMPVL